MLAVITYYKRRMHHRRANNVHATKILNLNDLVVLETETSDALPNTEVGKSQDRTFLRGAVQVGYYNILMYPLQAHQKVNYVLIAKTH